ncbi:hypothetical protein BS17DRAFT_186843 [Gyrodon lividus]|nr:hypothetical protein BS17DRAFT_186843 [Gyrodon lividus]
MCCAYWKVDDEKRMQVPTNHRRLLYGLGRQCGAALDRDLSGSTYFYALSPATNSAHLEATVEWPIICRQPLLHTLLDSISDPDSRAGSLPSSGSDSGTGNESLLASLPSSPRLALGWFDFQIGNYLCRPVIGLLSVSQVWWARAIPANHAHCISSPSHYFRSHQT